jgi:hypothetical protein
VTISIRRLGWTSLVAAVALSVILPRALHAQSNPQGGGDAPQGGQLKTVAVLAGANYDKLIADISFLGSMAGKPEAGQMAEGGLAFVTQGKGANLLDKSKPWGLIVQTDGAGFPYVLCLPVTKIDDVLEIAKGYGAEVKDADQGVKQLALPTGKTFYLKPQKDVVFLSTAAASLSKLPGDPQAILTKRVGEYDLSAAIALRNVPEVYRNYATQAMQAGLQQNMKQLPNESDDAFAARQKLSEAQLAQFTQLINEVDTITLGWAVDKDKKRTYLDFSYMFVPGSKMAERTAAFRSETNFAGFYQPDAAATSIVALKADPKLVTQEIEQYQAMVQQVREQTMREIDKDEKLGDERDTVKAGVNDLFDAFSETLAEAHIDGAATVKLVSNSATIIAGIHTKDPAKVESALKKLEPAAKKSPDFPGIKWNAGEHAGVKFHTLSAPIPEKEKQARELFGENMDVAIGIGSDAVYLALGRDNMETIKKAIDASAAEKAKTVPPFELSLSLKPFVDLAESHGDKAPNPELAKALADVLKQSQGQDHLRLQGQTLANGIKYHLEAEEGILRAIGAAAAEAQKKRLQAGQ